MNPAPPQADSPAPLMLCMFEGSFHEASVDQSVRIHTRRFPVSTDFSLAARSSEAGHLHEGTAQWIGREREARRPGASGR